MKKGFFLVTIFIVLCCKLSAQWSYYCHFPINPPPPILNGTFGSADFISADTGVYSQSFYISPSSGSAFFVCNTTDGAATWNTTFGGFMNVGIRAVRKQRTFYVIDYNPTSNSLFLSKSPDGGSSWINMGNLNWPFFINFFSCDTSQYFALSFNGGLLKYSGGIKNYYYNLFPSLSVTGLFFPDTTTGYIMAKDSINSNYHLLLKSIDGGLSWNAVFNDTAINIKVPFFVTDSIGFLAVNEGNIIKTNDGGANWQYINSGMNIVLNSLFFLNENFGFAAGDSGKIFRTLDGGLNWTQDSTPTTNTFYKIFFVNDSVGFAIADGNMYRLILTGTTSVWTLFKKEETDMVIYPIPSKGNATIKIPDDLVHEKNLTLSIYDNSGKLIQQKTLEINDGNIKLNLEQEAKGIYNVVLSNKRKSYNGKIVFE